MGEKYRISLKQLLFAVFVVAGLLGIGRWWYVSFVYATPLTRADELAQHTGERVRFSSTIEWGEGKADPLIVDLDGEPIAFLFVGGGLPGSGRSVTVTGVLSAFEQSHEYLWVPEANGVKVRYALSEGRWRE